ncbi:MAG: CRISPR-associated endoribonuclease Cas6 [Bacteroidetes bacterium]|nr:CRISPR-associated endoribonuclease Cas6 [Bacteroidota bacterium]
MIDKVGWAMRLHLTLGALSEGLSIPINYQYYLSTVLYRFLYTSSKEYASKLHSGAFLGDISPRKFFKYFCFSQLFPVKAHIDRDRIVLHEPLIHWYVSVAIEETLRHLILGMFESQVFFIENPEYRIVVKNVELVPEPQYERTMVFRMLSPLTVSVPENVNGTLRARYLLPDDPELSQALRKNILQRYKYLYYQMPEDTEFTVTVDRNYIEKRGGVHTVTKLVTLKQNTEQETKVRGFLCPVTIQGNPLLIKLAYNSGLGEKGSMGFGMLEIAKRLTGGPSNKVSTTL